MIDPYRKKDEDFHKSRHLPMVSRRDRQYGNEYLDCIVDGGDGEESYGDHDDLADNYVTESYDPDDRIIIGGRPYKLHPVGKQR